MIALDMFHMHCPQCKSCFDIHCKCVCLDDNIFGNCSKTFHFLNWFHRHGKFYWNNLDIMLKSYCDTRWSSKQRDVSALNRAVSKRFFSFVWNAVECCNSFWKEGKTSKLGICTRWMLLSYPWRYLKERYMLFMFSLDMNLCLCWI